MSSNIEEKLKNKPVFYEDWHINGPLALHHFAKNDRSDWAASHEEKLTAQPSADGSVTYSPNKTMHFLEAVDLFFQLPKIKVKDAYKNKVQIAWTPKVGHRIAIHGKLYYGDNVELTLDSGTLDITEAWFNKGGKNEAYSAAIGEIKELTEWTDELSRFTDGCVPQPWYISDHIAQAIPLHQLGDRVRFVYTFQPLLSLLRMRIRVGESKDIFADADDEWKFVSPERYQDYLTDVPRDTHEYVTMKGYYSYTNKEASHWKTCSDRRTYNVVEYIHFASSNPAKLGSNAVIDIDCKYPIQAIHYMAQNKKAVDGKVFCNYSTNSTSKGKSPCSSYLLTIGDIKYPETPCSNATFSPGWRRFPSIPKDPGYHVHTFINNYNYVHINDISVNASNGKVKLQIALADPGNSTDDTNTEYLAHAWVRVVHKLDLAKRGDVWEIFFDKTDKEIDLLLKGPNT